MSLNQRGIDVYKRAWLAINFDSLATLTSSHNFRVDLILLTLRCIIGTLFAMPMVEGQIPTDDFEQCDYIPAP